MEASSERRWYPVTTTLVALSIGAHVLQRSIASDALEAAIRMGALRPDRVGEFGEYFRLVMPIFLHHDLFHLGLNLLALVQLGVLAEEFFGARRTFVTYLWTGVAGLLASGWFTVVPYVSSIGASGAVLGLAGLLSGTMWFGTDPLRTELVELLGRRLTLSVLLTFAFGVGLWFVADTVDNWAHAGGFVAGVLFAMVWADPAAAVDDDGDVADDEIPDEPLYRTVAAAASALVLLGAVAWTAWAGSAAVPTLSLDTARLYAVRVSMQPGALENAALLTAMLERFDRAGASDEGLDTFTRGLAAFESPQPLSWVAGSLDEASRSGRSVDAALVRTGERWLELTPGEPVANNFLAWQLVVAHDADLRDPVRAEALATRALGAIPVEAPAPGCGARWLGGVDPRTLRAQTLDTRAEALFQQHRYADALVDQEEATALAQALALEELPQFESRLTKIRQSASRG
jgi:rhomboid protease GluP